MCVFFSYFGKLIKGDLSILIQVHGSAELLYDLTHAVTWKREVCRLEQGVQLICADVTVTVHI